MDGDATQHGAEMSAARAWETAAVAALMEHVSADDMTGTVLVAGAGEGTFLDAVAQRAASARRLMVVDGESSRLDAARSRLESADVSAYFMHESPQALGFAPGVFDTAVCVRGLVTEAEAANLLASFARVLSDDGLALVVGYGATSSAPLDELLDEAVFAADDSALTAALADHRARRLSGPALASLGRRVGLDVLGAGSFPLDVTASASSILDTGLVAEDLVPAMRAIDEGTGTAKPFADAQTRLRTYYGEAPVALSLEMLWLVARKPAAEVLSVDDADVVEVDTRG